MSGLGEEASSDYDVKTEMDQRLDKYRQVCNSYNDPRKLEHSALFDSKIVVSKHYKIPSRKFAMCVPPKVGSQSWRKLLVLQRQRDQQEETKKEEQLESENKTGEEKGRSEKEKIPDETDPLLAYRASFSTVHRDLTEKVKSKWLNHRKDPLTPEKGEIGVDHGDIQTLTFRQFVNFLTKCPMELNECSVLVNEGLAQHWAPYWSWCQPCAPGYEYHFIAKLEHFNEDKKYIFDKVGFNNSIEVIQENKTKAGHASNPLEKARYYGTLTSQEIYDLYLRYKLDHELFDYSPEEYLKLAKDYNASTE
eukprot:TCALIF_06990-PA protein Name:"Similar to CHST10 Carbohydrate sulfotransferase 10 (Gallus gallus)" AED:0.09 eAED:0.09 QI:0/0.5/0.4/0.8/1/1/5/109/305